MVFIRRRLSALEFLARSYLWWDSTVGEALKLHDGLCNPTKDPQWLGHRFPKPGGPSTPFNELNRSLGGTGIETRRGRELKASCYQDFNISASRSKAHPLEYRAGL